MTFRFDAPATFRAGSVPNDAIAVSDDQLPSVAQVRAAGPAEGGLTQLPREGLRWKWVGDRAREVGVGSGATVQAVGATQYVASGLHTAEAEDFLTCLALPALQREGGLVLHACGVELDGEGLVLLGSSGAGKSTAATQLGSARLLAKDKVAVFPADGRWWVATMPGGSEPPRAMLPARARCLPLWGALRVHKVAGTARVQRCSGARAVVSVLGAVRDSNVDALGYGQILDAALALTEHVPVGDLYCVLGEDLAPCVRSWMETTDG